MKPGTLAFITGFIFLLTLALPIQLGAQHTRYKLIDIGTFGGTVSYIAGNETGHRQLNNRGIVAGQRTSLPPIPTQEIQTCVSTQTASSSLTLFYGRTVS